VTAALKVSGFPLPLPAAVILSAAKDLASETRRQSKILRFAQDDMGGAEP